MAKRSESVSGSSLTPSRQCQKRKESRNAKVSLRPIHYNVRRHRVVVLVRNPLSGQSEAHLRIDRQELRDLAG